MSKKIEAAVNKIGKGLGELLKAFEMEGHEITEAHTDKVFLFLANTMSNIEKQARAARLVGIATQGRFSLDMDLPLGTTPAHPTEFVQQPVARVTLPSTGDEPEWVEPQGRLVGTKEIVPGVPQPKRRRRTPPPPPVDISADGEVDFISE